MNLEMFVLIGGIVLIASVFLSKITYKFAIPSLILFLSIGMITGLVLKFNNLDFNDYKITEKVATAALMIIIFSGGFDTNWKRAKSNSAVSITLASLGVLLTAVFVGLFTKLMFDFSWVESFLVGAIISSTDAAAVFSILRARKLNFKNNMGPLLEMESGSNDPSSYMITVIILGMITGESGNIFLTFFLQVIFGLGIGVLIGYLGTKIINSIKLEIDGLYIILGVSLMFLSYGIASVLGGNGLLAVYLTGLIMGNKNIVYKASLTQFFDGFSWFAQILLFFILGLFVDPSKLFTLEVLIPGIGIALFISFVARPLAVIPIMKIFKKPLKDSILVSWVGFRGAASIVFAIIVLASSSGFSNPETPVLIFNIVFIVSVVSVLLQGLLLVPVARKLDMAQEEETELITFTDYRGALYADMLEVHIENYDLIVNKRIKDLNIPQTYLIVLIKREDMMIPPKGDTVILADDILLISATTKQDLYDADKVIRTLQTKEIENK